MAKEKNKIIKVLTGLEPVRLRPGMYIGSTDKRGLHHILWEIIDNSVDEIANMYGNQVDVTLNEDGSMTVEDNGSGMPVYIDEEFGVSALELIFTRLHAGGKFDNETYEFSGGLHGVGASATNALSRWLNVEVYRDGKIYTMSFHSPEVNGKVLSGVKKTELEIVGKTKKKGTKITFLADDRVFKKEVYDAETIIARLRQLAFLNNGIKFTFANLQTPEIPREEFYYENGLADFIDYINCDKSGTKNAIVLLKGSDPDPKVKFKVEVAFQHVSGYYNESIYSFANNIETCEGGYHVTGFKSALTKCFIDYAKNNNMIKGNMVLQGEDFREGITAIVSVKLQNPQFEGQTKSKLGNPDIRLTVESILGEQLDLFVKNSKNKKIIEYIVKQAIEAGKAREAAKNAKMVTRQKNSIAGANLVGKYAACRGKDATKNELFIVEGDSAGGSAKSGRNSVFQAVLPIKGKSINVLKQSKANIYGNDEIKSIIAAIGTGTEENFNIDNLKFNKIIIMSDADFDGYHIRCLLLSLFYTLTIDLITTGKVYVANPPLYQLISKKGEVRYAYSDEELAEIKEEFGNNYKMKRFKGLGEMNDTELNDTTMSPKSRLLTRVTLDDAVEADKMLNTLMGTDTASRKAYIYKYANFNVGKAAVDAKD